LRWQIEKEEKEKKKEGKMRKQITWYNGA